MNNFVSFGENQTLLFIALALFLLWFIYRRPKVFFVFLFLGLFLAGLFYAISSTALIGSEQKKRLLNEAEKHSSYTPWPLLKNLFHFVVTELCAHEASFPGWADLHILRGSICLIEILVIHRWTLQGLLLKYCLSLPRLQCSPHLLRRHSRWKICKKRGYRFFKFQCKRNE